MKFGVCIPIAVITFVCLRVERTECARILGIQTVAGRSHCYFMSRILQVLVDGGHNVTVFTPCPNGDRKNYTEVDVSEGLSKVANANVKYMIDSYGNPFIALVNIAEDSRKKCDHVYNNWKLKEILSTKHDDFDLVFTEPFFSNCVSYVANKLDLPMIYITPLPIVTFMEHLTTGHISNPAVVSSYTANQGIPRTFVQRLYNTIQYTVGPLLIKYVELKLKYTEPKEYDLIPPTFPSLIFTNGHFITDPSKPLATNVVNIGGIHLNVAENLPNDILEFIQQSTSGVICFTFGSTIKMSSVPQQIKKAFLEALAELPQRVLMKYEEELKDKPKNIMTKTWLPQREILLHPNVKLFISHGGISGLYEAVDAGVPVLGFPVFGDQQRNVDNLIQAGMAISMDLMSVTKDSFLENVQNLLNDEKYSRNAKTASEMFKDQPMSPAQSVVYWTEYVIRHKGAHNLRPHAYNLMWYQYYLLDVISIILIFIFVVLFITYTVLKLLLQYCLSNLHFKFKSK